MNKVIALCGKVGSGKTFYARQLMEKEAAVLFSNDELFYDLFPHSHPFRQQEQMEAVNSYLMKKAAEVAGAGGTVILDWGFWTKKERAQLTEYFRVQDISVEWHYLSVSGEKWKDYVEKRNRAVLHADDGSSFYLSAEVLERANRLFEAPGPEERMIVVDPRCP